MEDILAGALVLIVFIAAFVIGTVIYILPSIIASRRNHKNKAAILAVNILLGWSLLGWVASLAWALHIE